MTKDRYQQILAEAALNNISLTIEACKTLQRRGTRAFLTGLGFPVPVTAEVIHDMAGFNKRWTQHQLQGGMRM
jgi:hypothetical protein